MLLPFREALQPAAGCTSLPLEPQEAAVSAASVGHAPTWSMVGTGPPPPEGPGVGCRAGVLEGSSRKQGQGIGEVCHTSPQCGSLQRRLPKAVINKTQGAGGETNF